MVEKVLNDQSGKYKQYKDLAKETKATLSGGLALGFEEIQDDVVPRPRKRVTKAELAVLELQDQLSKRWKVLYSRSKSIQTAHYNMRETFQKRTGLLHKALGWGYILSNENHRLKVLFKDGVKQLISNYKA